jgi:hypothetical protein
LWIKIFEIDDFNSSNEEEFFQILSHDSGMMDQKRMEIFSLNAKECNKFVFLLSWLAWYRSVEYDDLFLNCLGSS